MTDDTLPPASDFVSEPHELIRMELTRDEMPTLGEWKRAKVDRSLIETAAESHVPDPGCKQYSVSHPLRGERFVAIPHGCVGVAYFFDVIEGEKPN